MNARTRIGYVALLVLMLTVVVIAALAHLAIGARPISFPVLIEAVTAFDENNFDHQILVNVRLPRMVGAILCGLALGISGLLLQSLLRNPLGEPHILGLNAGASLAVVVCATLPVGLAPSGMERPLIAAIGAGALFALVVALASAGRTGLTLAKATFCGIALSSLASALVAAILLLDQETLEQLRLWLAGDLAGITKQEIVAALPFLMAGAISAFFIAPRLDAMMLGDAAATGLGISVPSTRLIGLASAALLCGSAVSAAGPIGFVGLIVPGIAHRLAGRHHVPVLPVAAMCGAAILLIADIAARTLLSPHEIATGIMTAFIGAPVFLAIVARSVP